MANMCYYNFDAYINMEWFTYICVVITIVIMTCVDDTIYASIYTMCIDQTLNKQYMFLR